jgi:hypothetical protein
MLWAGRLRDEPFTKVALDGSQRAADGDWLPALELLTGSRSIPRRASPRPGVPAAGWEAALIERVGNDV